MTIYEEPDPLNPEGSTTSAPPAYYAAGAQIRQFGVGGISTKGVAPNVLGGLANPPAAMVTAAAKVLTEPMYTENDLGRYFPSTEYLSDLGGSSVDGGTP